MVQQFSVALWWLNVIYGDTFDEQSFLTYVLILARCAVGGQQSGAKVKTWKKAKWTSYYVTLNFSSSCVRERAHLSIWYSSVHLTFICSSVLPLLIYLSDVSLIVFCSSYDLMIICASDVLLIPRGILQLNKKIS